MTALCLLWTLTDDGGGGDLPTRMDSTSLVVSDYFTVGWRKEPHPTVKVSPSPQIRVYIRLLRG